MNSPAPPRNKTPGGRLARWRRDDRGAVAIMFAIALPVILGFAALVIDYGNGLVIQAQNQRVADLSAFAGATAYSTGNSTTLMTATALAVAQLNGIAPANLAVALVAYPAGAATQAVRATVSVDHSLFLAPILGVLPSQRIVTVAYAQLGGGSPPCVLALDAAQSGITLSGGTSLSAPNCTVASNATVSVPCGTSLAAKSLTYNASSPPSQPCGGVMAGQISRMSTTDPLVGNASLASATGRLTQVRSMTMTSPPSVATGPSIDFAYDQNATKAQAVQAGCAATFSGSTWTLTCPSGGAYSFGNITLGGGISVNFNANGSAGTTYNFGGSIINTAAALVFGPGIYTIARGIQTGSSSTTTFGAGTFRIGPGSTACNGTGTYGICNAATLSFGGPSTFQVWGGIQNVGGGTLTLGAGSTNSFTVGPSSTGDALTLGGGSRTYLADATGPSSVFQLLGDLDAFGGGNCVVVSAAAQHDIAGSVTAAGALALGAGVYTIDGYLALGSNGGGATSCAGATISMRGVGVSIILSGRTTSGSGSCVGQVFCIAAGYNDVVLTAPLSGATANMAVIGPLSSSAAGATFAEGGSGGQIGGLLYFPKGPLTMSGGAGLSGGTQCLQVIGSRIVLSGGALLASTCFSGAAGSGKVRLVQ